MEDPTSWKTDAKVWRGWWDLRGWFWLIRDFGFRGAIAHVRWAEHMKRLAGDDDAGGKGLSRARGDEG